MMQMTKTIAAMALVGALAAPALAQTATDPPADSTVVVGSQDGQATQKTVTDPATAKMLMKSARPVPTGTMMVMHNGRLYTVADKMMSGDHMMSSMLDGTDATPMPTGDSKMRPAMAKGCCKGKPPMAKPGMGMGMDGMGAPPPATPPAMAPE